MSDPFLLASVRLHEGYREGLYLDTRKLLTFGNGRCLETNPLTAEEWRYLYDHNALSVQITPSGADWLMERGINAVESRLSNALDFWGDLSQARRNALIEMGYQMGVDKLMGFRHMLAAVRAHDWRTAYTESLDSDWARQTPERANVIANRILTGVV